LHTGTITFTGSVLSSTITGPLSINSVGTILSGNTAIKLTLAPATGVFSGTVLAGFTRPVPFSGILVQSLDEGIGLFQTPTLTGEVQITSP
jgi:hypothetical protein